MLCVISGQKSIAHKVTDDVCELLQTNGRLPRILDTAPSDRLKALKEHLFTDIPTLWPDPWPMSSCNAFGYEWYFGRAFHNGGFRYVAYDSKNQWAFSDVAYAKYYSIPHFNVNDENYKYWIQGIVNTFTRKYDKPSSHYLPPNTCGPLYSPVVFIRTPRKYEVNGEDSWLPFTSMDEQRIGALLGNIAFRCCWTTIQPAEHPVLPFIFNTAQLIVCCDKHAKTWINSLKHVSTKIHCLTNPLPRTEFGALQDEPYGAVYQLMEELKKIIW